MAAEIIHLPVPRNMTSEQREYWQGQAAYWGVREDDAVTALEYAQRHREDALRMLGMLAAEGGLDEGA